MWTDYWNDESKSHNFCCELDLADKREKFVALDLLGALKYRNKVLNDGKYPGIQIHIKGTKIDPKTTLAYLHGTKLVPSYKHIIFKLQSQALKDSLFRNDNFKSHRAMYFEQSKYLFSSRKTDIDAMLFESLKQELQAPTKRVFLEYFNKKQQHQSDSVIRELDEN